MKFLQKRWVAVLLCIVMIVAAISIGISRDRRQEYIPGNIDVAEDWGEENYGSFTQFVYDEAGVLSNSAIREISEYNASFDYSYGSICGVAVLESVDGRTMKEAAYDMSAQLELGETDAVLLLDLETEDWYFAYGEEFSYYVNNELEVVIRGGLNGSYGKLNDMLPALFSDLQDWYSDNMPLADTSYHQSTGSSFAGVIFFIILIILIVVIIIMNSVARVGRRVMGGWGPVFFFGGPMHRRFHHHTMHGPGPHPNPGPRSNPEPWARQNHSAGRSGGFGGSSRGGGFHGRSGGFGGGSRGGGFGGRR